MRSPDSKHHQGLRQGSSRITRLAVPLLLVAGFFPVLDVASAQAHPNLVIDAVVAPAEMTIRDFNPIDVIIRNAGTAPGSGRVELEYVRCGPSRVSGPIETIAVSPIPAGQQIVERRFWQGQEEGPTVFAFDDRPLPGPCEIRATLNPSVAEADTTNHQVQQFTFLRLYQPGLRYGDILNAPPGLVAQRSFFVKNLGNADDRYNISLTGLSPGWTFQASHPTTRADAGAESEELFIFARVPSNATQGEEGGAEIVIQSMSQQDGFLIGRIPVFVVLAQAGIALTLDPQPLPLAPGSRATLFPRIFNQGNAADTFLLEAKSDRDDVIASIQPNRLVIPRGENRTLSFVLEAAANATAGDATANLRAASENQTAVNSHVTKPIRVTQIYGIGLRRNASAPPGDIAAAPGEQVSIPLVVENLGNGLDQVRIMILASPHGWNLDYANPVPVPARQERDLSLVLQVPDGQPPGSHELRVRAESSGDSSRAATTSVTLTVPAQRNAVFEPATPKIIFDPDRSAQAEIRVRNTGNLADTFLVEASTDPNASKPPSGWTLRIEPASQRLEPAEEFVVVLHVEAPSNAPPDAHALVSLRLTTANDPAFTRFSDVLAASPLPNLRAARVLPSPATAYESDPANISIIIENDGTLDVDAPFNVNLTLTNDQTGLVLLEATQTLAGLSATPGTNQTQLDFPIPTTANRGIYQARFSIDDSPNQGNVFEQLETDNQATVPYAIHDAKLQLTAPTPMTLRPTETTTLLGSRSFRIQNLGSFTETIRFTAKAHAEWVRFTDPDLPLGAGETRTVPVAITLPERPGANDGTVTIVAHVVGTQRGGSENSTRILVNDTQPPTLVGLGAEPPTPILGQTVRFTARLADEVGIKQARLFLLHPDGELQQVDMVPTADGTTWSADTFLDKTGTYRYGVRAVDATPRENTLSADTLNHVVVVQPSSAPTFRLMSPQDGATIRPGEPITLHAADTNPIQRLWYVVGPFNRTMPVGNPIRIPTGDWADGAVELTVFGENSAGGISNTSLQFNVDKTPPHIASIDATPTTDPNVIRVVATIPDPDVASVKVTLAARGLRPPQVLLNQTSNGTYEAEIHVPDGLLSLIVTATDQVGNAAHREHRMGTSLSIKDAAVPGPQTLSVVAVLALALALTARKRTRTSFSVLLLIGLAAPVIPLTPTATAQSCPLDSNPIVYDAYTIITSEQRVDCRRIHLSADLVIRRPGRLELGQSDLRVHAANPVTILVETGARLVLHHGSRILQAPDSPSSYTLRVNEGGAFVLQASSIQQATEVHLRSTNIRLDQSSIEAPLRVGLTVDNVTVTGSGIHVTGGPIGALVLGPGGMLRLQASHIGAQTTTALQITNGAQIELEHVGIESAPVAVTLAGAARLTARNSSLSGTDHDVLSLGTDEARILLQNASLDLSRSHLSETTSLEQGWFVATRIAWGTPSAPGSSPGAPIQDAIIEIRNQTGELQSLQATNQSGQSPPVYVKNLTQTGSSQQAHGPFHLLARHDHSAILLQQALVENHDATNPLPIALPYDDDTTPPVWDPSPDLSGPPLNRDGRPLLAWSPARDDATPDHPQRRVAGYQVLRFHEGGPILQAGFATDTSFRDRDLPDGRHWYRVRPVDLAGNTGPDSNVADVLVDRTPPSLEARYNRTAFAAGNYSQPVRVDAVASDSGSGLAALAYHVDDSASTEPVPITSPGFHVVRVEARDIAGNLAIRYANITIDATPPLATIRLIPARPDGDNEWYRAPPQLNLTGRDATPGTIHDLRYRLSADTPWRPFLAPVRLDVAGLHDLHAAARDSAGNLGLASMLVRHDPEPPQVSIRLPAPDGENGWHTSPPSVGCEASDATSGIGRIQLRTNRTDWRDIRDAIRLSDQGILDVSCRATDVAGNVRASSPAEIKVDSQPPLPPRPRITRLAAGGNAADWTTAPPYDATSGLWKIRLLRAIDDQTPILVTEVEPTRGLVPIPPFEGANASYYVEAVDAAGLVGRSEPLTEPENDSAGQPASTAPQPRPVRGRTALTAAPPPGFDVAEARFYLDGFLLNATSQPPYQVTLDTESFADGRHEFRTVFQSPSGQVHEQAQVIDIRNGFLVTLADGGLLLASVTAGLVANALLGILGVRRWLRIV